MAESHVTLSADEANHSMSILTAGEILKRAREEGNITTAEIAEKTRLSEDTIVAMENNDYTHIIAPFYVRAYLRVIAQVVGVAEQEVLTAYEHGEKRLDNTTVDREQQKRYAIPVYRQPAPSSYRLIRWSSIAVMGILIVLVVIWWQGQRRHESTSLSQGQSGIQIETAVSTSNAAKPAMTIKPTNADH